MTASHLRRPSARMRPIWILLGIPLLTLLAYAPALRNGFIWDDDRYVTQNVLLQNRDGLQKIWFDIGATDQYYPLTYTTFWIEKHLWGDHPAGYHVVNLLLHIANALLLWRLLTRLQIPGAAFAAALFAVHPLHVESVAWITERKNTLSLLFYLLAFHAYARFDHWPGVDEARLRRWGYYFLAIACFLCALLSKTVTATFPAAILLILWWKRGKLSWRDIAPTLPLFLMALGGGWITVVVESAHVNLEAGDATIAWPARFLIAGRAVWFYLGKLIWPYPLIFTYPQWPMDARNPAHYLDLGMAVVLVIGLAVAARRMGRGLLAAVLFYGGSLLPALGLIDIYAMRYSYVADHFAYLPSIGLIVLAAAAWSHLAESSSLLRRAAPVAATILLSIPAILTYRHCGVFRDQATLWTDTVQKNPTAWMAHNNLGLLLQERGDMDAALKHYQTALRLKPDLYLAHYNAAIALQSKGLLLDAGRHYESAIKIKPDFANAHFNYALLLQKCKSHDEAIRHFEEVLRITKDDFEAQYQLGGALADAGRLDEAVRELKRALRQMQDRPTVYARLAQVYFDMGDLVRAEAFFRAAIKRKADYAYAHHGLGGALDRAGKYADAITAYQAALRLDPTRTAILDRIGLLEHLLATSQPAP